VGASAGVDTKQSTVPLSIQPALSCPVRGLDTTGIGVINGFQTRPDTMCCDVTPFSLFNTHDFLGNMTASMSSPLQNLKNEILILKTVDCEVGDERGGVFV
jgi:hypothetical protein